MVLAAASVCLLFLVVVFVMCNQNSPGLFLASETRKITPYSIKLDAPKASQSRDELQISNNNLLDSVLQSACFENKTVIIASLNRAWATGGMLDLFLESFHTGDNIVHLLDHLVLVSVDPVASAVCNSRHKHCFTMDTEGLDLSGENRFMTPNYLESTKRRIRFLGEVLKLGYSFVYTDVDILWFRSPLQHFSKNSDVDLSCNHDFNGNSSDIRNHINGGLLHVRSNERTIRLYELWYERHAAYPNKNDQDVFEAIKHSKEFESIGLGIRFVPTEYLSGYCRMNADLEKTCTMHAICCIGQGPKMSALKKSLEDWLLFRSMTPQESREAGVHFRPSGCSI